MRYLTIEQRELLRDALTRRAARLRTELGDKLRHSHRRACRSLARRVEDTPDLDAVLDAFQSEVEDPQARQEIQQLRVIGKTLARLRSPEYGVCGDCGGDVPFVFLRDDPAATLCRECRERRDLAPFVPHEI